MLIQVIGFKIDAKGKYAGPCIVSRFRAYICADCGIIIPRDATPWGGWTLEDGRKVCHKCCVKDLKKIAKRVRQGKVTP
jgi:hypothetical protein